MFIVNMSAQRRVRGPPEGLRERQRVLLAHSKTQVIRKLSEFSINLQTLHYLYNN